MLLPRISRLAARAALLLLAGLSAGCTPTCENVCTRLVEDCGNLGTERETAYECEEQCTAQRDLYWKTWTDQDKRDAFNDELTCLASESCEDIDGGICYDPEIWSF